MAKRGRPLLADVEDIGDNRRCAECKRIFERRTGFYFYNKRYTSRCKICLREKYKNKPKFKANGLSAEEKAERVRLQPYCMICLNSAKKLAVDHDHRTGKIRAVLCYNCNTALGKFKEDTTLLQNAIAYLDYFREKPE